MRITGGLARGGGGGGGGGPKGSEDDDLQRRLAEYRRLEKQNATDFKKKVGLATLNGALGIVAPWLAGEAALAEGATAISLASKSKYSRSLGGEGSTFKVGPAEGLKGVRANASQGKSGEVLHEFRLNKKGEEFYRQVKLRDTVTGTEARIDYVRSSVGLDDVKTGQAALNTAQKTIYQASRNGTVEVVGPRASQIPNSWVNMGGIISKY